MTIQEARRIVKILIEDCAEHKGSRHTVTETEVEAIKEVYDTMEWLEVSVGQMNNE